MSAASRWLVLRTFFVENKQKMQIKFAGYEIIRIFAVLFREHSSVGLEHLPYKQRVGGSTPSAPTKALEFSKAFFVIYHRRDNLI